MFPVNRRSYAQLVALEKGNNQAAIIARLLPSQHLVKQQRWRSRGQLVSKPLAAIALHHLIPRLQCRGGHAQRGGGS